MPDLSDYIDPTQMGNNQTGGELGPMDMRPFTGNAGGPLAYHVPPSAGPVSFRAGMFVYCLACGIAIAVFLTLAVAPVVALAGGLIPVALWLVIVMVGILRQRLAHMGLVHQAKRQARQQARYIAATPVTAGVPDLVYVPPGASAKGDIQVNRSILPTVLQIVNEFGVKVNSGYRTRRHNWFVGGARRSDHVAGNAVDFVGTSQQMQALYTWAQGKFPYVEPESKTHGDHVHISFIR
jgi:hypothetical protein